MAWHLTSANANFNSIYNREPYLLCHHKLQIGQERIELLSKSTTKEAYDGSMFWNYALAVSPHKDNYGSLFISVHGA